MKLTKRTLLKAFAASPALMLANTGQSIAQAASSGAQVPGYYRYHVGDIEVTVLLDGYTDIPTNFIIGYEEEAAKDATAKAYHRFSGEMISIPANTYVIKTGDETILLDTGGVTGFFPTLGHQAENMAAAGISPDDITAILLTHTHPDHIGGLTLQDGSKAFANATLVVNETEWGFIHNDDIRNAAPEEFRPMIDVARAALAPYAEGRQMFDGEATLFDGVKAIPLPGHTPGQSGYVVESNGESLTFIGDVIHFTSLQFAHPDWGIVFDGDVAQARATREALLARMSAEGTPIAGAHVDYPGVGYVEAAEIGYRYITAPLVLK